MTMDDLESYKVRRLVAQLEVLKAEQCDLLNRLGRNYVFEPGDHAENCVKPHLHAAGFDQ